MKFAEILVKLLVLRMVLDSGIDGIGSAMILLDKEYSTEGEKQ